MGKRLDNMKHRTPHFHANVHFPSAAEHNQRLADGAIRCMTQLIERSRGEDYRHMLEALTNAMEQIRKEME